MNTSAIKKTLLTLGKISFPNNYPVEILNSNRTDASFLIRNNHEILIAAGVFNKGDVNIEYLDNTFKEFPTLSLFFWINSTSQNVTILRKTFDTNSYHELRTNPCFNQFDIDLDDSLKLIPLGKELENVLFEAHSHLRDIDGLHADSALDEICKLLFAKLYDEKQKNYYFKSNYSCVDECAAIVRGTLNNAVNDSSVNIEGKKIGIFSKPMILSSPAIYKVVKEFEKYDFSNSPVDIKGRAFQNLISPALRSGMGQYFTPLQVINFIIECIQPKKNEKVIDPFCGSCHFLSESVEYVIKHQNKSRIKQYVSKNLFGIDKSERMIRIGLTDILLMDGEMPALHLSDSLLDIDSYANLKGSMFDVVVTNPPFGSVLGKETFSSLGKFDLLTNRGSVPLEILGLERSVQLLKEGGRLAIVLPDGIFLNKYTQYIRDWLSANVKIRGIISLPSETFAPFGTSVKTSILFCTKGRTTKKYDVYMGQINNIGYDASGRMKNNSDVSDAIEGFVGFLDKEGW